jgi:hypothetical protein
VLLNEGVPSFTYEWSAGASTPAVGGESTGFAEGTVIATMTEYDEHGRVVRITYEGEGEATVHTYG